MEISNQIPKNLFCLTSRIRSTRPTHHLPVTRASLPPNFPNCAPSAPAPLLASEIPTRATTTAPGWLLSPAPTLMPGLGHPFLVALPSPTLALPAAALPPLRRLAAAPPCRSGQAMC
jgi:hypothetical protein